MIQIGSPLTAARSGAGPGKAQISHAKPVLTLPLQLVA